jgi:hypothetical protein
MENRKIKYVIAPEGCKPYIEAGKKYRVLSEGKLFCHIKRNNFETLICLKNCDHLNSQDWTVVYEDEDEMSVAQIIAWVLFVIACVLSMCYLFSHRTNFQEVIPPYTDKGGSTLFIERP